MFADVVFNKPIEPLTYEIPQNITELHPGMRVRVPLRNEITVGIVYKIKQQSNLAYFKKIDAVLDREPVVNDDLIETAEWISRYYVCFIGEALWTVIPKGIKKREKQVIEQYPYSQEGDVTLTEDQEAVFHALTNTFKNGEGGYFLLYGVTGSGKTEIYLRIIHEVVNRGRGAILLVPEISLTPQTIRYFSRRVGDQVAILHSRLTKAEKINEWHRILSGEKKIVIGARSAIFAPLSDIGIVIIDEEHETSYKSDETPRYSAKSVAYFRVKKHRASLLLGSATPSVESFYLAKLNQLKLLQLPKRVLNQSLPRTHVSDLRKVRGKKYISQPMLTAIDDRLKKKEQVILFLNRRGFAPHVYCENCGYVFKCRNCDITLTYHKKIKTLNCHYCGFSEPPSDVCPNCRDENITFAGFGTEKIERILNDCFPGAVVVRMDTDTVKKRTSMAQILSSFSKRQIDILIGTQIVTKGLHFPNVTLVGVLNADIPLNFPDFRAAERTFNLITQVSGRAGRGEKGGEVIIQTYNPVHYAIQTARNQDYEEFFTREIKFRQVLLYPPFCRIVRFVFRGENSNRLMESAEKALSFFQDKTSNYLSILGPSFCPISRIKNNYRVHVIIKVEQIAPIISILQDVQKEMKKCSGYYLEIDIDPVSML